MLSGTNHRATAALELSPGTTVMAGRGGSASTARVSGFILAVENSAFTRVTVDVAIGKYGGRSGCARGVDPRV